MKEVSYYIELASSAAIEHPRITGGIIAGLLGILTLMGTDDRDQLELAIPQPKVPTFEPRPTQTVTLGGYTVVETPTPTRTPGITATVVK